MLGFFTMEHFLAMLGLFSGSPVLLVADTSIFHDTPSPTKYD